MGHVHAVARRSAIRPLWAAILICIALAPGCEACDSCDRSTRAGSREDPYIRSPRPGGGTLITERPVIPEHLRANCHVCPEWCTQVDLRPLPPATVIATYRRHALMYADETTRHPWPNGWATLEQMACIVAGGAPLLKQRFVALLRDPDPAIRWPAAVHTLQHGIDKSAALATLQAMVGHELPDGTSDGPDGPDYAGRAYFALTEYEIGNPIELP